MKTSVIILSWNGSRFLPACLDAVLAQEPPPDEVLVVDNGSLDDTLVLVEVRRPTVRLIANGANLGFAGGMNVGLRQAGGDVVVLLNQDTVVAPGWLAALREGFLGRPRLGIAGCKIFYPDGRVQHAGAQIRCPLALGDHAGYGEAEDDAVYPEREVDYVTGAAMAIRREALATIGLLDEGFQPAYFEDADLCYRARAAGFEVRYLPAARLVHHESTSVPRGSFASFLYFNRNRLRFVLKHFPLDRIVADFLPAERRHLLEEVGETEQLALQRAYLEAVIGWSPLSMPLASPPGGSAAGDVYAAWRAVVEELLALRLAAGVPEGMIPAGPVARSLLGLRPQPRTAADGPNPAALGAEIERRLEELRRVATLREFTFTSRVPLVGLLLARVRSAAAAISARWLVRSLIEQQQPFNFATFALLDRQHQELSRLLADWARSLATADWAVGATARNVRIAELELQRRLETLEARCQTLERQVEATRRGEAHARD